MWAAAIAQAKELARNGQVRTRDGRTVDTADGLAERGHQNQGWLLDFGFDACVAGVEGTAVYPEGANEGWRETRIWMSETILETCICDVCQHSSEEGCSGALPHGERQAPVWHSFSPGALCQPQARLWAGASSGPGLRFVLVHHG